MATDIFKLRQIDELLPIEEQDIPPDAAGQWRRDFAAIHGRSPNQDDHEDWQWSLRFAKQYGRGPEREDWERHFYDELGKRGQPTTKAQASREATPEFLARPSSGVDRDHLGKLVVPFPWQSDESGAENSTDQTARFRQYGKWDLMRDKYPRGSPEWNSLTTAMNQLQTSTAPWYFAFSSKFGLRDEILKIAGNRTGQDRVQTVASWIRQKQGQGIDPFNQADPYTAAYKAQAQQAAQARAASQAVQDTELGEIPVSRGRMGGSQFEDEALRGLGLPTSRMDVGQGPTGPNPSELRPYPPSQLDVGQGPTGPNPSELRPYPPYMPPGAGGYPLPPKRTRLVPSDLRAPGSQYNPAAPTNARQLNMSRYDPANTMVIDRADGEWKLLRDAIDPDMNTAAHATGAEQGSANVRRAWRSYTDFLRSLSNAGR